MARDDPLKVPARHRLGVAHHRLHVLALPVHEVLVERPERVDPADERDFRGRLGERVLFGPGEVK